jgi:hypothetical protein
MKIILISIVALLSTSFNTFAQTTSTNLVQYIDCHFDDPAMEDRVIVSLVDADTGTFFYSNGLDSEGNDNRTPALKMQRLGDIGGQSEMALFKAVYQGDRYGTPASITFMFGMPKAKIFKTANHFNATVNSSNGYSGGLNCFARLYPKN